jgi:hypothetical protein
MLLLLLCLLLCFLMFLLLVYRPLLGELLSLGEFMLLGECPQ